MFHPHDNEQNIPPQPEQGPVATHIPGWSNTEETPNMTNTPDESAPYSGNPGDFSQQSPVYPNHSPSDFSQQSPVYPNHSPDFSQQPPAYPGTIPAYSQPPRRSSNGPRAGAIFLLVLLLAVVFGVGLFSGWEYGRGGATVANPTTGQLQTGTNSNSTIPAYTASNIEKVREAVIAKVSPSVVQVNVTLQSGAAIGSGVIIDKRGYIVTNNHVVTGAQKVEVVLFDGTKVPGTVVGTDATDDLAVIKINPPSSNLSVLALADSSKLQVGQDVLAIGNPLGITQTVTNGIVSALNRTVSEGNGITIPNAIQTDAPINPGNSGGALVDMQGNLVGIPTLAAIDPEFNTPASGVGFAIPSNRVNLIVPQIIATGHVTHTGRAALGIHVTTVDATLASQDNLSVNHGALIVSVVANGPAAQAHFQPGDVIVQIGSDPITDVPTLGDVLANKNPGDTVSVHIYRGNQQLSLNVTLGELQAG